MIGTIITKNGKPVSQVSNYQPSNEIAELTAKIQKDYGVGYDILHRPYREFGEELSPLQVAERDQKIFNNFVEPDSTDPDEQWKWKGVRPITRNKVISIAAHFVAAMMTPGVRAQNEDDEEDRDAAELMKDLLEWNVQNMRSPSYSISYLYGVIAGLVNPVAYLRAEFLEVLQTIKEKSEDGKITKKEIVDEVLSGLKVYSIPFDEVLIANAYEYELQRQRFIIHRKLVDYDEAKALYVDHKNFQYVRPGVKAVYDPVSGSFFDLTDEENPTLVEVAVYYNRREDIEVPFVNGIYMGKANVDSNIMRHRDHKNRPKYNLVKYGYGPIDEKRFFFYKSAVNEFSQDQELIDKVWQMTMDGTFLSIKPPIFIRSTQAINSSILYPGAQVQLEDETANIQPISLGQNLTAGYNAVASVEASILDTSRVPQFPSRSGTTAFEVARQEQQARVTLGLFGQMFADMVTQLGDLMIDLILQHQTVANIEEIADDETRLRYKTFLLPDQVEKGKKVTKQIKFVDEELQGSLDESMNLLEQEGGLDSEKRIYLVNPQKFRRLRFLVYITAEQLMPKNEIFEKSMKLEAYDRMIANPFVDQEAVTRDFLVEVMAKGESAKYMKKQVEQMLPQLQEGQVQQRSSAATTPGSIVGQISGRGALAELIKS